MAWLDEWAGEVMVAPYQSPGFCSFVLPGAPAAAPPWAAPGRQEPHPVKASPVTKEPDATSALSAYIRPMIHVLSSKKCIVASCSFLPWRGVWTASAAFSSLGRIPSHSLMTTTMTSPPSHPHRSLKCETNNNNTELNNDYTLVGMTTK